MIDNWKVIFNGINNISLRMKEVYAEKDSNITKDDYFDILKSLKMLVNNKTKFFNIDTENIEEIELSPKGEIKSLTIYLYLVANGWNIKNLVLLNEENGKSLNVFTNMVGKTLETATKVTLNDNFVDFNTLKELTIKCDFVCDDGEVIKIRNAKIKFDSEFLNLDNDKQKVYYKLTPNNIGLKPITFGNPIVSDYIEGKIINF